MQKNIQKTALVISILIFVLFIFNEICIMKYLKKYGYGINELLFCFMKKRMSKKQSKIKKI